MSDTAPHEPQEPHAGGVAVDTPRPPGMGTGNGRGHLVAILVSTLLGCGLVVWSAFNLGTDEKIDNSSTNGRVRADLVDACNDARAALAKAPQPTDTSPLADWGKRIDTENAVFETMLRRVGGEDAATADGQLAIRGWVKDFRSVLARRRADVAAAFRRGVVRPELVIPLDDTGRPVTKRMQEFSNTQHVPGCDPGILLVEVIGETRHYTEKKYS